MPTVELTVELTITRPAELPTSTPVGGRADLVRALNTATEDRGDRYTRRCICACTCGAMGEQTPGRLRRWIAALIAALAAH